MAVREIPASYESTCDGCGAKYASASKSRPPHWSNLIIERDAYDFQGCAVADGTIRRLLCDVCANAAAKAINEAIARRAALEAK